MPGGLPESRALVTSLETHDARFSKLQEILKKYGVHSVCTPLTTATAKSERSPLAVSSGCLPLLTKFIFFRSWLSRSLAFDNALNFDASQAYSSSC